MYKTKNNFKNKLRITYLPFLPSPNYPMVITEYGFLFVVLVGFVGYTFAYPPLPGKILVGEFFGRALIVLCQH